MRIACFASIDRDSLARYVLEELLPVLTSRHQVDIFSDLPEQHISGLTSKSLLTCHKLDSTSNYDIALHLFEDGTERIAARFGAAMLPGVTWFLDYTPQQDMPMPLLDSPWLCTTNQIRGKSSEWSRPKGKNSPYGPHAFRESSISPAAIFCDSWSRNQFTEHLHKIPSLGGREHSYLLPFPVSNTGCVAKTQEGLLIFGGGGVEDHLITALYAAHRAKVSFKVFCTKRSYPQVLAKVEELSISPSTIVVQEPDCSISQHWRELCAQSRAVLFPRYSAFGTISPFSEIALATGNLVVLPKYFKHQDIPQDVLYFYDAGLRAGDEIYEVIRKMPDAPEVAKQYCQTLAPEVCVSRLEQILTDELAHVSAVKKQKTLLLEAAKKAVHQEAFNLLSGEDTILSDLRESWAEKILEP